MHYINEIHEIDLAYIAGFFDADGCITVSSSKSESLKYERNFRATFLIVNTDEKIIYWIRDTVGAGSCYIVRKYNKKHPNWRPVHRYQISGPGCRELIDKLIPFVRIKKDRLELAKNMVAEGHKNIGGCRTQAQYDAQHSAWQQIKQLNRRGVVQNSI
jgi:hypothetical protein